MTHADTAPASDASKLEAACGKAMELQLAGQLDLAGQLYGAILQAVPQHPVANYCLGMLRVQSQRPSESLPFLMTALQSKPDVPDYWLGYLEALTLAGQTDEALRTLELGRQHGLAGAAVEDFAARLAEKTRCADARPPQPPAAVAPQTAVPQKAVVPAAPAKPVKRSKPGRSRVRGDGRDVRDQEEALLKLLQQQEMDAALTLARSLTERYPKRGFGWKALGACLPLSADEAITALQTAVRLMPRDAEAHVNLGLTLARMKRFDEAESHLHAALKIDPEYSAAHYRLAVNYELKGQFDKAEASLRRGIALRKKCVAGDYERGFSHLLFLLSHNPLVGADELFAEHCRYGEYFEGQARDSWQPHPNSRNPARCLKVGFVSGDLCRHAVASFVEPIFAQLKNRPGLELHAYYTHTVQDDVSRRLLANFKTWNVVSALSDLEVTNVIRKDEIDILIDLSGHTGLNRLPAFARRPAPIQISWIGYPGTTGLRSMDYFLADPHFLPPGQFDRHFTEKLVYLPAQTPFQPQASAPPVNPLPALSTGRMTFGSFNRLGKINASTIRAWSQLLGRLPDSTMLIAGMEPGGKYDALIDQFAACGIARDRLMFHERCGVLSYLALYHQVDMCLDTTPYNGGTTTIHALWMGVPTLSIAGPTPAARSGAAILGQMGLQEFVARDATELADKGVYWATHLAELAQVRTSLRDRWQNSSGRRADVIAEALEHALRRMWKRWCENLPAESFQITADEAAG